MKTYKEINEEIFVSEAIKQKTLEQMMRKHGTTFKLYRYVVCIVVLFIGSCMIYLQKTSNHIIEKTTNEDHFVMQKYIQKNNEGVNNMIGSSDIVGTFEDINEELRKQVQADFLDPYQLTIPKGYVMQDTWYQYVYEEANIGPYANVIFRAQKDDNYFIYVEIQDQRMPQCTPSMHLSDEELGLKTYKDYRLSIHYQEDKSGSDSYWVSILYKNYSIRISATLEKGEDFEAFLKSFFI